MSKAFFSEKNEAMLQRVLYADICRRTGGDLTERQAQRLIKTVNHYMGEVNRVQGELPLQQLNKEVLAAVVPDYISYLNRASSGDASSVKSGRTTAPSQQPELQDLSTRYSQIQTERTARTVAPPAPVDFRIDAEAESSENPLDMFEKLRLAREEEVKHDEEVAASYRANAAIKPVATSAPETFPGLDLVQASDTFKKSSRSAELQTEEIMAERERKRLETRVATNLPVQPDMREILFGSSTERISRTTYLTNYPESGEKEVSSNQLVIAPVPSSSSSATGKHALLADESVKGFVEKQHNLFLYSADRDWSNPLSNESRYNFTIQFDPSNRPTGSRLGANSTVKFKNITRIEFIKAILPVEGLEVLTKRTAAIPSTTANLNDVGALGYVNTTTNTNVLSYPYVQVRIPELDTNNYGTNTGVNASFAVLQYDALWNPDGSNSGNRGYTAMIPKFMKCQKVYDPTPLATIQKLSVSIERPDGTLLSKIPDTLDIQRIIPSLQGKTGSYYVDTSSSMHVGTPPSSPYYFLKTFNYFTRWTVVPGERVVLKGVTFDTSAASSGIQSSSVDFLKFLQRDEGHIVVEVGNDSADSYKDGANYLGYANYIIIEGSFTEPVTGRIVSSAPSYTAFGNSNDDKTITSFSYWLNSQFPSAGRLMNMSHQVQISLMVITREHDGSMMIRADNLN
jgi:hypothetical protein